MLNILLKFNEGRRRTFLSQYNLDSYSEDYADYRKRANTVSYKIDVFVSNSGYMINGVAIQTNEFAGVIEELLIQNLDYAIVINFEDDINYGIVSSIEEVIYSLRDEFALKEYETDFHTILNDYEMRQERLEIIRTYTKD